MTESDPSASSSGLGAAPPDRGRCDLCRNLRAGLRTALFRRVRVDDFVATPTQLVLLVILGLALQIGFAVLRVGLDGHFDPTALPRALVYVPLLLLAAWLMAQRERRPQLLGAVPVLFCAVSLPYDVAFEALDLTIRHAWLGVDHYDGIGEWLWDGCYAFWLAAVIVGVVRVAGATYLRAAYHAAVLIAVVAVPLWHLPNVALWQEPEADDDRVDWYAVSREETFYAQPALLERTLAALRPERPGIADLYFVGVAGYASEDVFRKEIDVIGELFRTRFDAQGRSVMLVNNPRTVGSLPVATATALARTLERVGQAMNPEEDVLFLYLTTHGSEDHRLALDFWPLQLHDIDPDMLRKMLDQAGIRWRVVVISACYSGGFVDALKDDHTLVITAAEATRPSFGCGNASDFTYFGKAYFDEALRGTYSFIAAFDRARMAIDARERSEGQEPSNPQIYVGAAMRQKLTLLARRLQVLRPLHEVRAPERRDAGADRPCTTCQSAAKHAPAGREREGCERDLDCVARQERQHAHR